MELNVSWPSKFLEKKFMVPPIDFSFLFKAWLWYYFRVVFTVILKFFKELIYSIILKPIVTQIIFKYPSIFRHFKII